MFQVPTSNLGAMEDDFPEFEPFDDEVQPRGFVPTGRESASINVSVRSQCSSDRWSVRC